MVYIMVEKLSLVKPKRKEFSIRQGDYDNNN